LSPARNEALTPRPTLLVVDDLPIFRELAALSLSSLGHVIQAPDDQSALALVRREHPRLILARFPPTGPGGVSLCEAVKQDPALSHIPVVLVTSGDQSQHHAEAVLAGADDVLTKPLDRASLLRAVRRLVDVSMKRGLPRVEVETPVRLSHHGAEAWGIARNLSRGGLYVEADDAFAPRTEIQLEFPLPGRATVLTPRASVVWIRIATDKPARGMGLRFLGLDGASARSLEHYVHEHGGASAPTAQLEASR
jgi:uncharacterized protein (TIGR02266 family)